MSCSFVSIISFLRLHDLSCLEWDVKTILTELGHFEAVAEVMNAHKAQTQKAQELDK